MNRREVRAARRAFGIPTPAQIRRAARPTCVFCGGSGAGVLFNIFTPRFPPFGTACVKCEETLPPGTEVPS